jgi:murein DD-endopeptidase / murein LD-carboxypeptidase
MGFLFQFKVRKPNIFLYSLLIFLVLNIGCHTHKHVTKPQKPVHTLIKDKNKNNNNNNVNNDNNNTGSKFYANYSKKWGVKLDGDENKKIIESIDSWLGTPYKYGGMSKSGIDCSGFTLNVYKESCNIKLNRSAADQVNNVYLIDKDKLKFGDLVFFKISGNKVSHVGIYINDSKFVHASTKKGVTISDLNDAYYKKYFYKGGKIKKI